MALAISETEFEAQTALEAAREFHEKYLLHSEVKDLNLAIDYYIKAVKLNPNMPETYYRLANLLYENGQISLDGAIEQCRAGVKVAPGNADAHLYTGYFMTLAGRYIEANYEFETAIKLDPIGSARARITLAQSLIKEANVEKAILQESSIIVHTQGLNKDLGNSGLSYWNESSNQIYGLGSSTDLIKETRQYYARVKLKLSGGYDWADAIKNFRI